MPTACLLLRDKPHYRRDAFAAGLAAAGWSVNAQPRPSAGDLLVIWNRYGVNDDIARDYEAAGGRVVVAENGFLGRDAPGGPWYALSLGEHHHGGAALDFSRLKHKPTPWRATGDHILVCAQRGFGSRKMASQGWATGIEYWLRHRTKRPIRVRKHPGNSAPVVPLADDLRGAHAAVIWSSCAGVSALLAGIPVFYAAPRWIAEEDAAPLERADLERPFMGDRADGLANAAGNSWSVDEIASGAPFHALGLSAAGQGQGA